MGSVYNLRPMPAEAVIKDGQVYDFRKALTDEELIDRIIG
jgi:hypothetical protein